MHLTKADDGGVHLERKRSYCGNLFEWPSKTSRPDLCFFERTGWLRKHNSIDIIRILMSFEEFLLLLLLLFFACSHSTEIKLDL